LSSDCVGDRFREYSRCVRFVMTHLVRIMDKYMMLHSVDSETSRTSKGESLGRGGGGRNGAFTRRGVWPAMVWSIPNGSVACISAYSCITGA
jgi:hypothetical protein